MLLESVQKCRHPIASIAQVCKDEGLTEALCTLELFLQYDELVSCNTFCYLIQACIKRKDYTATRGLLPIMLSCGICSASVLFDHLIRAFGLCGNLDDALQVFQRVSKPNAYTWNAIISVHVHRDECEKAIVLYHRMHLENFKPNDVTLLYVLQACGKLQAINEGHLALDHIITGGMDSNAILINKLVDMYAKCAATMEAHKLFRRMSNCSIVTWSALIAGYTKTGLNILVFELFVRMHEQSICPDRAIFLSMLKTCANMESLWDGKLVHAYIIMLGIEDVNLGSSLIYMYAEFACLADAQKVFDGLPCPDVVAWGALVEGYAMHGCGLVALEQYEKMQAKGIKPSKILLRSVLKSCAIAGAISAGHQLHDEMIRDAFPLDVTITNALSDMYVKCGYLETAHRTFRNSAQKDDVSWAIVINGSVTHGNFSLALKLCDEMYRENVKATDVTISSVLQICGNLRLSTGGRLIHDEIVRNGISLEGILGSSLLDMYGKCRDLKAAQAVFDQISSTDIVSWGILISIYVLEGQYTRSFSLIQEMKEGGIEPDDVIFINMLKAYSDLRISRQGRVVHDQIIIRGHDQMPLTLACSLIDMYAKCGDFADAYSILINSGNHDTLCWTSMIAGCVLNEQCSLALSIFREMQQSEIQANHVTFSSILKACGHINSLEQGRCIHEQILRMGIHMDDILGIVLVEMYARCGSMADACRVFDMLPVKDVISWSVLVAGYALQGNHSMARMCLQDMRKHGLKPDPMFFSTFLYACCYGEKATYAEIYLNLMRKEHGFEPTIEHYGCIADVLGRCGWLFEAKDLLQTMPVSPDSQSSLSLLFGCTIHSNVELTREFFYSVTRDISFLFEFFWHPRPRR